MNEDHIDMWRNCFNGEFWINNDWLNGLFANEYFCLIKEVRK